MRRWTLFRFSHKLRRRNHHDIPHALTQYDTNAACGRRHFTAHHSPTQSHADTFVDAFFLVAMPCDAPCHRLGSSEEVASYGRRWSRSQALSIVDYTDTRARPSKVFRHYACCSDPKAKLLTLVGGVRESANIRPDAARSTKGGGADNLPQELFSSTRSRLHW